tara:strand:+ start:8064 stop:8609 length:546 start_codon:yes stop_codon:yes gene_type:complete
MIDKLIALIFLTMVAVITTVNSYAADNTSTVNYANQPPPSAISAGVQSYSQMICSFPVVGAVQTSVVGFSTGTTFTDWNCERRMLSNSLSKAGLKVASISVLCAGSKAVWSAMLHSGTPCSIWNGKKALIGKEAIKHYKMMGYINEYGQILRYPDYLGANGVVSNFSNSNSQSNGNIKSPK